MAQVGQAARVLGGAITCAACGRVLTTGRSYAFGARDRHALRCFRCAVRYRPIVRRAAQTAGVVGTILTAINQGDALLHAHLSTALLWKIPLTYVVPYLVSTYSALSISYRQVM